MSEREDGGDLERGERHGEKPGEGGHEGKPRKGLREREKEKRSREREQSIERSNIQR